jgi:RimJ/RimL family protein N-acetyltransferase
MMADPQVGDWLGGTLNREQANAQIDRFMAPTSTPEPGWLAIERRSDGVFLGGACLRKVPAGHPLADDVEVGWRLARAAWGAGYATEAARSLLSHGFDDLGLAEIVTFTANTNIRSRAVMERLGFARRVDRDFDHPALVPGHPLRPHVVYDMTSDRFRRQTA